MNFIIVSPQFPSTYHKFAAALKNQGFTVLGIGDTPYDQLPSEVKIPLTEYYFCPDMNNYEAMFKAVAFFSFKYGKIAWIESNNEWWLENDARLRTDFNVTTGIKYPDILRFRRKSAMKEYYIIAGIATARYALATDLPAAADFAATVGYPIFVKPDGGVGSVASYKIADEAQLARFFADKKDIPYIMEEFIEGTIVSYDGIADGKSEVVYEASNVFPTPNYLVVNDLSDDMYYTEAAVPDDLREMGRKIIKAFEVKHRLFHLEFFRLGRAYRHLGNEGDLVPLEVNMRPAGGYTPEMISAATGVSLYEAYARVVAGKEPFVFTPMERSYVAAPARRTRINYVHSHDEILAHYSQNIFFHGEYPPIIKEGMGDYFYMAKFPSRDDVLAFFAFVLEKR